MCEVAVPHTEKTWNIWSCMSICGIRECDRTAVKWQWMHRYSSVRPSLNPFQYRYQLWSRVEDAFAFYCTELIFTWSRQTASFHRGENTVTSLWPQEYGRFFSSWLEYQNMHSYTAGVWRAKRQQSFTKGFWRKIPLSEFNVSDILRQRDTKFKDSNGKKTLDSSEDNMIVAQSARQISAFSKLDWNVLWGSAVYGL